MTRPYSISDIFIWRVPYKILPWSYALIWCMGMHALVRGMGLFTLHALFNRILVIYWAQNPNQINSFFTWLILCKTGIKIKLNHYFSEKSINILFYFRVYLMCSLELRQSDCDVKYSSFWEIILEKFTPI